MLWKHYTEAFLDYHDYAEHYTSCSYKKTLHFLFMVGKYYLIDIDILTLKVLSSRMRMEQKLNTESGTHFARS